MIRDISNWPAAIREDFVPGAAPTLDRLAEKVRQAYRKFGDPTFVKELKRKGLEANDLRDASIYVVGEASIATRFKALQEMAGLSAYSLPEPLCIDTSGDPGMILYDLLYAGIETRARLDEDIETAALAQYSDHDKPQAFDELLATFDYRV